MEFLRLKGFEGLSDLVVERGDAAFLGLAQESFELGYSMVYVAALDPLRTK
jgi:hypothetical protein